jgi:hypothetical protein
MTKPKIEIPIETLPVFVDLTDARELVINRIIYSDFIGGLHTVLLGTDQTTVVDGQYKKQIALVARLRFDPEMAKMLRDALNQALNAISAPPPDVKPN